MGTTLAPIIIRWFVELMKVSDEKHRDHKALALIPAVAKLRGLGMKLGGPSKFGLLRMGSLYNRLF